MSPFESKAQMRAAFAGALGPEMKAKAEIWAHEMPNPASVYSLWAWRWNSGLMSGGNAEWERQEAMSPFKSKAQMRAAFAGALGPEMKAKAETWAHETPNPKRLPAHVKHAKARTSRRGGR